MLAGFVELGLIFLDAGEIDFFFFLRRKDNKDSTQLLNTNKALRCDKILKFTNI